MSARSSGVDSTLPNGNVQRPFFTSFQYTSEHSNRSFALGASPTRHTSLTAAPFMIIMFTSVKINYNHSSVSLRSPSQNTLPWMLRITWLVGQKERPPFNAARTWQLARAHQLMVELTVVMSNQLASSALTQSTKLTNNGDALIILIDRAKDIVFWSTIDLLLHCLSVILKPPFSKLTAVGLIIRLQ